MDDHEGGFLAIDGPFMRVMELVVNVFILNFLVVLCSLPIFTAGAAITAMCRQLYRMTRDEDTYIVKGFFKDFASNFRVATIAWLILLAVGGFLGFDLYSFSKGADFPGYYKFIIFDFAVVYMLGFVYVFPVIARYETGPVQAIKNAYAMAVYGFLKSILMVAITLAPWILSMYVANFVVVAMVVGISLPAYINVFLYRKTFEVFEGKQEAAILEGKIDNPENDEPKPEGFSEGEEAIGGTAMNWSEIDVAEARLEAEKKKKPPQDF